MTPRQVTELPQVSISIRARESERSSRVEAVTRRNPVTAGLAEMRDTAQRLRKDADDPETLSQLIPLLNAIRRLEKAENPQSENPLARPSSAASAHRARPRAIGGGDR